MKQTYLLLVCTLFLFLNQGIAEEAAEKCKEEKPKSRASQRGELGNFPFHHNQWR